jgi:hypothetical protein
MAATDFWNKAFPVIHVSREDLVAAGFPRNLVEQIDDETMQEIASAMNDVYCDHGFWEDVELCTNRILRCQDDETTGEADGFS